MRKKRIERIWAFADPDQATPKQLAERAVFLAGVVKAQCGVAANADGAVSAKIQWSDALRTCVELRDQLRKLAGVSGI